MLKIKQEVLESKLANIPVEEIAKQSGFQLKKPTKAMSHQILLGFFLQLLQEKFSLRCWAMKISLLLGETFSKQALASAIRFQTYHPSPCSICKEATASAVRSLKH